MIEQSQPSVEIDRLLRRLDTFGLAAVSERAIGDRQVGIESRLEAKIADLLGRLQALEARLDTSLRIERAVKDTEVRIGSRRCLQVVGLGQRDAALDLLNCSLELPRARKRDPQRIVSLRSCDGRLPHPLRTGEGILCLLGFGQRLLGPSDGAGVIAGSESEAAYLLEQLGTLDRIAVFTEPLQSARKAGARPLSVASLPVQTADLAVEPRGARSVKLDFVLLARCLIVCQCLLAPAGQCQQIGKPFAHPGSLATTVEAAGKCL